MRAQEKFDTFAQKYPHPHQPFYSRPHITRRRWFQIFGAGVGVSCLAGRARAGVVIKSNSVQTQNTARNVIFLFMTGAPSHTDTFDLKVVNGTTPSDFNPAQIGSLLWPSGLLPNLATHLPDMAIIRSVRAWAAAHQLGQHWVQIGRNPAAALGDIAPNIGSIVAVEKESDRQNGQVLPTFLALNALDAIGSGYLSAAYDPMRLTPSPTGIPNTTNVDGLNRMNSRWNLLHTLDDKLRVDSPLGQTAADYADFTASAQNLMYNPDVQNAFNYTADDSTRYGNTSFGNACLLAQKIVAANLGSRFVQVEVGGWDMHQNIYGQGGRGGLYTLGKTFDVAVSAMLDDLKKSGQLSQTLVVMMGEFGRTVGKLTGQAGRDHLLQQFVAFAGAGVQGGRAIGSTDATGSQTDDPGWSRNRDVKPEDIEATIYSAMGINWTSVRYDDPFGRGFEYVPFSNSQDLYGPVNELWVSS